MNIYYYDARRDVDAREYCKAIWRGPEINWQFSEYHDACPFANPIYIGRYSEYSAIEFLEPQIGAIAFLDPENGGQP